MSAHVVVLDATARRATVKTTPAKYLADILQDACSKLGHNPTQYSLKHNRKQLDLSLSFRLSGLSSGAKLELVQISRSPSVVTVALQLPESEARGAPNSRIIDKFPSTTTLWLVLRKFEAGVAGTGPLRNLTARGVSSDSDTSNLRLFYEIPVLQIVGRELSSFTDLQKSLAQLGFNDGNVLIRLSFRRTEETLDEAMPKIAEYFKSTGDDTTPPVQTQVSHATAAEEKPENFPQQSFIPEAPEPTPEQNVSSVASYEASLDQAISTSNRPVTVFSPPSDDTPSSAQIPYNEEDYIPSIEHAKSHQRILQQSSRNKRLPTNAEMAAKEAADEKRRADIREVDVKVRFPDQSQVVAKFGPSDTGQALYDFVRSCLVPDYAAEKFALNAFVSSAHANVIPESIKTLLIKDLGLVGRVLVNFTWAETTMAAFPPRQTDILRQELRSQARKLKVEQPQDAEELPGSKTNEAGPSGTAEGNKPATARKSGGVPKWLKLPGQKR